MLKGSLVQTKDGRFGIVKSYHADYECTEGYPWYVYMFDKNWKVEYFQSNWLVYF